MALVTCPDCRAQVSDQAPSCIHCGYPIRGAATVPMPPAPVAPPAPADATLWAPQPAPAASLKPCPTCGTNNRPHASHCVRCGRMLMEAPPAYVDYNEHPPVRVVVEDEWADTARALATAALLAAFAGLFALGLPLGLLAVGCGIAASSRGDRLGIVGAVAGGIEVIVSVLAIVAA